VVTGREVLEVGRAHGSQERAVPSSCTGCSTNPIFRRRNSALACSGTSPINPATSSSCCRTQLGHTASRDSSFVAGGIVLGTEWSDRVVETLERGRVGPPEGDRHVHRGLDDPRFIHIGNVARVANCLFVRLDRSINGTRRRTAAPKDVTASKSTCYGCKPSRLRPDAFLAVCEEFC
jgi:hypothetical protein